MGIYRWITNINKDNEICSVTQDPDILQCQLCRMHSHCLYLGGLYGLRGVNYPAIRVAEGWRGYARKLR